MQKIKLLIILLLTLCFSISGYAKDDSKDKQPKRHRDLGWWFSPSILRELNLNDKQAESIRVLKVKSQKEFIKTGADLSVKKIDFEDAMSQSKFNEANIKKIISDIARLQSELTKKTMMIRLDAYKILVPQQRSKLKKLSLRKDYGLKKPASKQIKKKEKKAPEKKKDDNKQKQLKKNQPKTSNQKK